MPVFHTKTIESILEPVAQQVSQLMILHEEAEDGNAMPDLARPIQAVKAAVDNLVRVGYETVNNSDDQILKQDMPPALNRVEDASYFLLDASDMLRADPYSAPARKKLIEGSRGILQGTSAMLLAFDEMEVRKIIRNCKHVLEYLAITEVVESMEDLVTYVKNLSPGIITMTKLVDAREKELTHQVHREMLQRSIEKVKTLTPVLISGIKTFVSTRTEGTQGVQEAQENRDYTVRKMSDEIQEIIRVLQLTTYDEDEWDADDLTVMKKAQSGIEGRMKNATDWLQDPRAVLGGVGEKSLRQILEDAMKVTDRCTNPADADAITKSVGDIQSMMDALAELRSQGMGDTPQAVSLARGIQQKLGELKQLVDRAVANSERSGIVKAAHTMDGRMEQAQNWLRNPGLDDKGLGDQATRAVIAEGRKVANCLRGAERQDMLRMCDEVESLTNQLADLCRRGQGNSPQAKAIARNLSEKLQALKKKVQDAILNQIADDFIDITTPLKQMSDAALAPLGTPNREGNFEDKVRAFENHASRLANTAKMAAAAGGCSNKRTVEGLMNAADQVDDLTPQVINAAKIVLLNPGNQGAQEHFDLLKKEYTENMEKLRALVDEATDTVAFIKASEEGIIRDTERTEDCIKRTDAPGVVANTSSIARRANRVIQVAQTEADNSEDPSFVQNVGAASENLKSTVAPMVQAAKLVASNPRDTQAGQRWRTNNDMLIGAVRNVRKAVTPKEEIPPPPVMEDFPPPPDLSQLNLQDIVDSVPPPQEPYVPLEQERKEDAPPRPPLPHDSGPPRPPPPDEQEAAQVFGEQPQPNQPIMLAAHSLHQELKHWDSRDNELITAAKKMALLMAKLSQLVRGEGGSKKELIATAKSIAQASEEVTRLAKALARECTDKRMRTNLLQVCERIPTIGTQLKILSTVKATMLGAQAPIPAPDGSEIVCGSEEDQEATDMLVGNAQNLMQSVRETVRAAEAASIKIRVDSGYSMRWVRMRPWYS